MARFRRRSDRWVLPLADVEADGGVLVRGLVHARRLGLAVAGGLVITPTPFREMQSTVLPPDHDVAALLRVIHRQRGVERAARARERVLAAALDHRLAVELAATVPALLDASPAGVELAASPLLPSPELAEAAGLLAQRVTVLTEAELVDAVRRLWSTVFDEGVLRFCRFRRLKDLPMALSIAPCGATALAGSLVTEPSVPGVAPAFRVLVDRGDDRPPFGLRLGEGGQILGSWGARSGELPSADRCATLYALGLTALVEGPHALGFRLGEDGGAVVTAYRKLSPPAPLPGSSPATRWARCTVGAGAGWTPLTPLALDIGAAAAEARCRRARVAAGRPLSKSDTPVVSTLGRVYVQSSMLDVVSEGSDLPRAALHELGGAQLFPNEAWAPGAPLGLARLGMVTARVVSEVRRLGDAVDRFDREAEQQRRWLRELDLGILPDDSLSTTLREGHEFIASVHRLAGECAAALSLAESALSAALARPFPDERRRLAAFATAGAGSLETAKAAVAFAHVAEIARRDPSRVTWLASGAPAGGEGPTARALRQFLEAFGDVAIGDAELSTPRWQEDPRPLLVALAAAVQGPPLDVEGRLSAARSAADARRARIEASCSFVEARLVRELVGRVRDLVRFSARLRLRAAHSRSMMRTIAVDVDGRLRRIDDQFPKEGAFQCRYEELARAVSHYRADLAPVVELRRASPARGRTLAPLAFLGGVSAWPGLPVEPGRVAGIGVSPGKGAGAVRFVGGAGGLEELSFGDVLVVESVDVALGPLMLLASAVVAEVGNPWSSGAVLARELGVPLVTGVPNARLLLAEGEAITVDGTSGEVVRVDSGRGP